jgi:transcriptional regulator with XRE-family HTH domain
MNASKRRIRIRPLREGLGFTRVSLDRAAGLSPSTVRIAEEGLLSERTADALAGVLGVEAKDLLPRSRP